MRVKIEQNNLTVVDCSLFIIAPRGRYGMNGLCNLFMPVSAITQEYQQHCSEGIECQND